MRPVVLVILDGWGIAPAGPGNAISLALLPNYQRLLKNYPHTELKASGEAVGLPRGEDGNTETGHLNIGAGYIVNQDLQRINFSIADGSFFQNSAFLSAIDHARKYESNIHLLGLVGAGGVHSNIEHLLALLQLLKEQNYQRVFIHVITDGRDSPPKSALLYLNQLQTYLDTLKFGRIATVMGRYYAMDRDRRWERTEKAYLALTSKKGNKGTSVEKVINDSYKLKVSDEFIIPTILYDDNIPLPRIKSNDSVIFFNYRIDRPRQLTRAFVINDFKKEANIPEFDPYAVKYYKKHQITVDTSYPLFDRGDQLQHLYFVTMTEYSQSVHSSSTAYPPHIVAIPIGSCISEKGLSQLHMTESEKERFVTYYFNGQRETPFANQDNVIIPSPRVPTYDLKPEMSAYQLTDKLIENIKKQKYNFIIVNYPNVDMVGHTGGIQPTIKACEVIDNCLGHVVDTVLKKDGTLLVTADHGNAEELINTHTGGIDTEHSINPVPFIAINKKLTGKNIELPMGILADIAPTILSLMHIDKPNTMSGSNLLENVID